MQLPLQTTDVVYHVGELDLSQKGARSYEAHGLSVSLCPEAWQGIAEIPSEKLHAFMRPNAAYLDVLGLDAESRETIRDWAHEKGLLETITRYRMLEWDHEEDVWRWSFFPTQSEAIVEAAFVLDVDETIEDVTAAFEALEPHQVAALPEGAMNLVEAVEVEVLTPEGVTRAMSYGRDMDGFDVAAMFWVEDVLRAEAPDVVGVWWMEEFAPEKLSAPRGAILPVALTEFSRQALSWDAFYEQASYHPDQSEIEIPDAPGSALVH